MPKTKIYYDQDANLDLIKDKTIAIIGYGNQGSAQALNMKDSGVKNILVGSRKDSSAEQAVQDGFPVLPIEEATQKADIIFILLPLKSVLKWMKLVFVLTKTFEPAKKDQFSCK